MDTREKVKEITRIKIAKLDADNVPGNALIRLGVRDRSSAASLRMALYSAANQCGVTANDIFKEELQQIEQIIKEDR